MSGFNFKYEQYGLQCANILVISKILDEDEGFQSGRAIKQNTLSKDLNRYLRSLFKKARIYFRILYLYMY